MVLVLIYPVFLVRPGSGKHKILHALVRIPVAFDLWWRGCTIPGYRAKAKRRYGGYERLSRFDHRAHNRHPPLGRAGRGGVGRYLATQPGHRLERTQSSPRDRAEHTSLSKTVQ